MIDNYKSSGYVHTTEQVGTRTRYGLFSNYQEPVFANFIRERERPEIALGIFDYHEKHLAECQRLQVEANRTSTTYWVRGPGIYESWVRPDETTTGEEKL